MTTLSASRTAAALGLDTRWSTPLQEQRRLLGLLERGWHDAEDIEHPATQGQVLELAILQGCRLVWQKRHGHPIFLIHTAGMPGEPGDPAGGLHLVHPTFPISAHPDGYFLCHACQTAWLVDAKRYGAIVDTEEAPEALKAQLTIGLECTLAHRAPLELHIGQALISGITLGCVLRFGGWDARQRWQWDCLEIPVPPEARQELVQRATDWMERYVLPAVDLGWPVPDAEPVNLDDYLLLWPEASPGKVHHAAPELAALITAHHELTTRSSGLASEGTALDEQRADLKRQIFQHLDALRKGDVEAITLDPDGPAVVTLKTYGGPGKRQLSYKVAEYNRKLKRSRK